MNVIFLCDFGYLVTIALLTARDSKTIEHL